MDFFDDAILKAKEALDLAYKKTGEAVNLQKNKFDVASLESKRAKDYEALGEIYFELVKDNPDNDERVAELVEAVKAKNEKIENIRKDIRTTKNKRICPNCHSEVEKEAVFCSSCGTKLIFEENTEQSENE